LTGDRPGDVFRQFRDHISRLLNLTVTDAPLSLTHRKDALFAQFAFRDQSEFPMAAPLFSGGLFLAVSQQLQVEPLPNRTWRLRTLEYSYHLLEGPSPDSRWIFRWEYVSRRRRHDEHPRHHVHVATVLDTPAGKLDLDRLHLSTGWVTIEEVIRFLITEVGVKTKAENWDEELMRSEGLFREWTGRSVQASPPRITKSETI
jgi:hypothetical protein